MSPTISEVEAAIALGLNHFHGMYLEQYTTPPVGTPVQDADPIPLGKGVVSQQPGLALMVVIGADLNCEIGAGPWEESSPGNVGYYPVKLAGPFAYVHAGDPDRTRQSVIEKSLTPQADGSKLLKIVVDYEMGYWHWWESSPNLPLYTWRTTYESRWGGNLPNPRVKMTLRKTVDRGGSLTASIWSTYELLQSGLGEDKVVYDFEATEPYGIPNFFPTTQFAVRLIRPSAYLMREGGLVTGRPEMTAAGLKIEKWLEDWPIWGDQADSLFGLTHQSEWDDWHYNPEVWYDPELYEEFPRDFNVQPYKSHLHDDASRWGYLNLVWNQSPYHHAMKAMHRLWSESDGEALESALSLLEYAEWDGIGVRKDLPRYTNGWRAFLAAASAVARFPFIALPIRDLEVPAYKSDWTGAFLAASCLLYTYAKSQSNTKIMTKARSWADEAAAMALRLQIPSTGRHFVDDGDLGVGEIYTPESAGAFLGAYEIDSDDQVYGKGGIMWVMRVVEGTQKATGRWDPNLWPRWTISGGASFENTLLFIKALLLYKNTILNS